MKKTLYFVLPLLLALAFFTCKSDGGGGPSPLDPRLIGGRWYTVENYSESEVYLPKENNYYEFTKDSRFIYTDKTVFGSRVHLCPSGSPVYSQDGMICWKDEENGHIYILMQYEFYNEASFYESPLYKYNPSTGSMLVRAAINGNLISYRIYNGDAGVIDDGRLWLKWFLRRFKEDGTPY